MDDQTKTIYFFPTVFCHIRQKLSNKSAKLRSWNQRSFGVSALEVIKTFEVLTAPKKALFKFYSFFKYNLMMTCWWFDIDVIWRFITWNDTLSEVRELQFVSGCQLQFHLSSLVELRNSKLRAARAAFKHQVIVSYCSRARLCLLPRPAPSQWSARLVSLCPSKATPLSHWSRSLPAVWSPALEPAGRSGSPAR